jgi:pyruvate kinase
VGPGDTILLDDGKLRLQVVEVGKKEVVCEVKVGGMLSAHKGINLPGVAVSAPSFTAKDREDLEFGILNDIDYVALSFVRTPGDIRELRRAIISIIGEGRYLPVIAKIEKPQAIANIDAIVAEADGIMIARGDLGVELAPEDVPMLQKMIIRKCNEVGTSPTPTRAEASDVANAVVDGVDAVMLSGETSVGKYPLEAVQIMGRIIGKVESEPTGVLRLAGRSGRAVDNRLDALGQAACVLAEQMHAAAIVIVTRSGQTARVVSRYRPGPRIIAVTDRPKILRRMSLFWGVQGLVIGEGELNDDSDRAMEVVQGRLLSSGLIQKGEFVVILAGQPFFARGSTNSIKVEKVE